MNTGNKLVTPGKPRPLWKVILYSVFSGLLYYGYYKWVIQDELRRYQGGGWSGAVCLTPFILGVILPQALWYFDPDVLGWFGWFSLLGVIWIYIVQFRLYQSVNGLYTAAGLKPPLRIWWLFVPGLNLLVGLRQIHFLSEYWAMARDCSYNDPITKAIPLLSANR